MTGYGRGRRPGQSDGPTNYTDAPTLPRADDGTGQARCGWPT